jgi:hypothetical protein
MALLSGPVPELVSKIHDEIDTSEPADIATAPPVVAELLHQSYTISKCKSVDYAAWHGSYLVNVEPRM